MIVYSVTVKVDLSIHNEWLNWMKNHHIPKVIATEKFIDYKIHKILNQDETDGITYNFHYRAESISNYFDYKEEYSEQLQNDYPSHFKGKFVSFRTLLKEV